MRSFIAIELSEEAREELGRVIDLLKKSGANVKWVKPGTVHLTLKFLGDVPEGRIQEIENALKGVSGKFPPFSMTLGQVGVFPDWKYVKVIWVGIAEGAQDAQELAKEVDEELSRIGFEKEKRPFKCHLTLGRVRSSRAKKELKEEALSVELKPVNIPAKSIVLFSSELTSTGAVHTPIAEIPLTG